MEVLETGAFKPAPDDETDTDTDTESVQPEAEQPAPPLPPPTRLPPPRRADAPIAAAPIAKDAHGGGDVEALLPGRPRRAMRAASGVERSTLARCDLDCAECSLLPCVCILLLVAAAGVASSTPASFDVERTVVDFWEVARASLQAAEEAPDSLCWLGQVLTAIPLAIAVALGLLVAGFVADVAWDALAPAAKGGGLARGLSRCCLALGARPLLRGVCRVWLSASCFRQLRAGAAAA